jgi:protoporphyrinogen oxidase/SAM-dependent methyltransferase
MTRRVVVVGGGIAGLAAARLLARQGDEVTVLESAPVLGGLVAGFEVGGVPLERYYHYVLPQETHVQDLLRELGLLDDLEWFSGTIAVLTGGKAWPFTTPLDLLRFQPLALRDRVRAGVGALRLGRVRDWPALDEVAALDWLTDLTSKAVTDVVWTPLLRAKFGPAAEAVPAAWMWARLDQRRQAHKGTSERVGYLRGGFGRLFEALATDITEHGGSIRTSTPARRLVVDGGRVTGVETDAGVVAADRVVYAGQLPRLGDLVDEAHHDPRWAASALGAVCMVLQLRRPITDVFWTNVCDRDLPFGGIIEHTNLVPTAWYGGRNVAYLSRYFTHAEEIATADLDGVRDEWVAALLATFRHLDRGDITDVDVFRTPYAAPLVSVPYLPQIPPMQSHLPGLVLATTAQVYPQDRGMDQGVRSAALVTGLADAERWRCPVCEQPDHREVFTGTGAGTEGGVDAAAFRPSSDEYGQLTSPVVECRACGHRTVADPPPPTAIADAYAGAVDEVSLREETGQVATADLAVTRIEGEVGTGRMLDVGCWTGSFLVAAQRRGWDVAGVEPSSWAAGRARERGIDVFEGELRDAGFDAGSFDAIVTCDVLEHLVDPAAAVARFAELLTPGGALYLTVPDAGSRLARAMGRRWWAVVPMHLQYFSRSSMRLLLSRHGFEVRHVATHPKLFSGRYYAERAASFLPVGGELLGRAVERSGRADRLIGPDFGDRMEVIAVRREKTEAGPA